ncbi:hypothetical protein HETIRDRAFT_103437 [Heterobasidion irregulare TC 32-1]|uniref:Uncharacterized protein n=1 Tax=Heterobasidion irregulare (strain TC 32-1) TaxID=747525 RepID=W4K3W1_HETIT|nr:uncharacterized protein HETIRDRAFT_103437 [Heterobasidion irregulare TC 32-1]ETW80030.1 hypothetical protein HETIRDRAFT_103437 [Heterobasidion irregulare TC 32-1]
MISVFPGPQTTSIDFLQASKSLPLQLSKSLVTHNAIIAYIIPHVAAATIALPIMYLDVAVTSQNDKVAIRRHSREVVHVLDARIIFDVAFELPGGLYLRSLFYILCAVVLLENIKGLTVDISSDAGFEPSYWLNLSRNAERVQTMDVSGQAAMYLISALKQEPSLGQAFSAARVLLFPALKTLIFGRSTTTKH